MTALAKAPQRRGACPGLSAPMPTGDGLLIRLRPVGTIALETFTALCAAARRHGNGIIEITSRGSIQVRGLRDGSPPKFAQEIATLDIAADDGVPVHCNALAGIGEGELIDVQTLAADLRRALAHRSMAARLSPKVSVAIDSGDALGPARLSADIRLRAQKVSGEIILGVGIGGDHESAAPLGAIGFADGVEVVVRLLDMIARHGRTCRARDIIAAEGDGALRAVLADILLRNRELDSRLGTNERHVIGLHALRGGSFACGIGLAFGHSDATSLELLAEAASAAGANGFRAAPGRALLAIGVPRAKRSVFSAAADKLGFIIRADDPRRNVIACAGAPICASAHIASRSLAQLIAGQTRRTIHISGCAKGCAHAAPAALTVVGTPDGCTLVADGTARDVPFTVVPASELPAAIAKFVRSNARKAGHV